MKALPKNLIQHPATAEAENAREVAIELLYGMAYASVYCEDNTLSHED